MKRWRWWREMKGEKPQSTDDGATSWREEAEAVEGDERGEAA